MKATTRRQPSSRNAAFSLHATTSARAPWARVAGWWVIAAGALALAVVAGFYHPVGDYVGETDFYGGYVEGAKLFQAGHLDPARYAVVGPVFDILLGLLAWPARDFFVAAKLIAIVSAVVTWVLWRGLVAARLGDGVAFWSTAFLVANPVFFQCGYSAMSHGTAVCLQVATHESCSGFIWQYVVLIGAPWLLSAILLAPVFYNPFYALVQLPFYVALAGVAIGSGRWALALRGFPLKPVLAAFPLALSIHDSAGASRLIHRRLPTEVREAGRVLAGLSEPGQHVIARKGHIGYYSGRAVVAFPRVMTVGELADYCRKHDVGWIYYSWYEALLRPEFRYLLDPEATVPGLIVVYATQRQPGRLLRIGAGFGEDPTWWRDENQRRVHVARGAVQVLDARFAWAHHLILAQDAAARHDARSVLEHADAAIRGRPEEARAWAMRGVALHAMGRLAEARQAYETALRLKPGLPMAEQGLQKLP